MVWKRARRPFAGGAGSRRRAPGFECHGSRPAFRGPRNMETDGIMRKEDGPIRHKENGAVRFRYPCRESTRRRLSEGCQRRFSRSRTVGHGGVGRSVADPRARTTTGVWIGGCEWARRRAGRRILVVVATPEV